MDSLFEGDEVFEAQTEEAKKFEEMNAAKNFVGYKLLNSCQNCFYQNKGDCHVLERYGQNPFPVIDLGKCKHWKKGTAE